jgi:hypothetical protein
MFDTIKAFLPASDTGSLETALSGYKETVDPKTGDLWQRGTLKNLRLRGSGRGVTIEGSLPAFLWGTNAMSMTRQATAEAIEEISDRLKLPIADAQVWQIHLANNFIMRRPPIDYLTCMIGAPYYKRSDYADRETVNFKNTLRELCFYDKARELENKRKPLPDLFKGKNVLRYEARFIKRLSRQFKRQEVHARDLSDEVFYMTAINRWKEEYFLIQKIRKDRALNMTGQKEYLQSLAFYGLQNIGGVDTAMDLIKGARLRGEIGKKTGQRLKKLTLSIAQAGGGQVNDPEECIPELDNKIRQAVACYR